MLISEAFEKYYKLEIVARGLSPKTMDNYRNTQRLLLGYFDDIDICHINEESIVEFKEHLLGWQKPDTARLNLICLRSVIRFLRRKGAVELDPEDIRIPRRSKRVAKYLEIEEVLDFIEVMREKRRGYARINRLRNVAIVEILFSSGIRVSELCKLNRDEIKHGRFNTIGKSRDPRPCFINPTALEALHEYLSCRTDANEAMFVSNQTLRRITPGNIQRVFRFACARSNFENVTPHTMRHSFSTYMLDRHVDFIYLSKMLGHVDVSTTMRYAHVKDKKLEEIHKKAMIF